MITIAREGGSVGVFVEGNSSFNGALYPFADSIGKLVLMLKLPLVIFNFKGGYLTKPRWALYAKKGKFTGEVREVIHYDTYKHMSAEAITNLIRDKININAYIDTLGVDYDGKNERKDCKGYCFHALFVITSIRFQQRGNTTIVRIVVSKVNMIKEGISICLNAALLTSSRSMRKILNTINNI